MSDKSAGWLGLLCHFTSLASHINKAPFSSCILILARLVNFHIGNYNGEVLCFGQDGI